MTTLMPKMCLLLLGTPRLQPPLPPPTMTHPMRCKMIVVTVETRLVRLRLRRQKGCLQRRMLKNLRTVMIPHCRTINSSTKEDEDSGAELLLS
jgi:hypothetical protein